jgi:hypothetical protein
VIASISLGEGTLVVHHRSCSEHPSGGYCIETLFNDGSSIGACPLWGDPESLARAETLGYGDDLWLMTLEHEILHSISALVQGKRCSVVLWNVSHGIEKPKGSLAEESNALALARYVRTGYRDPLLQGYSARTLSDIRSFVTGLGAKL